MGRRKSQYAIQKMNEDTINDYIYITPYLDEIKRIRENCKSRKFVEPKENELIIYNRANMRVHAFQHSNICEG
jgi:hypothetical protein